jgi:AcrR family transcriptional regulator
MPTEDPSRAGVDGVREPRQARSRRTFETLVAAAFDMIAELGPEGSTVQELLRRTGVGAGSFYARFDGRDALIRYVGLRFWAETEAGWAEFLDPRRWSGAPAEAIVGQFIRILVLWTSAKGGLLRALLVYAMTHPDGWLLDRTTEIENTVADQLGVLVTASGSGLGHPDPEFAVHLATLQVFATLRSRAIFAGGGRMDGITDAELAGELTRVFLSYVRGAEAT